MKDKDVDLNNSIAEISFAAIIFCLIEDHFRWRRFASVEFAVASRTNWSRQSRTGPFRNFDYRKHPLWPIGRQSG